MHMTAHPDDENNAVLALYARHVGTRVALVTATRGDGGQNEIGTELFDALGVLRTEELLDAHRFDGAEQYFTRAVDFGYSFSQEETLEKWGRQEILGDFVRHIRTLRPDVIVTMSPDGSGGGQHHQTSAVIATEAFRAAADPAQFPEQLRAGLRPWQAIKLYRPAGGFGGRGGRGGLVVRPGPDQGAASVAEVNRRGSHRRLRRTARSPTSIPTSTSRCSAARSAKSAASPRACTCARGACRWSRRRAPRLPATASSRPRCPSLSRRRRRRSSRASTCRSPAWHDSPAIVRPLRS